MRSDQRIGFLGPVGTFSEQALLSQPDLARAKLVPLRSFPDILSATEDGEVDLGFVAIENSIEGTVNVTLDTLAFDVDLMIQREVVIAVQLNLLARRGATLNDIQRVVSFPHALAQCRAFLGRELPHVRTEAANSTAEAARMLTEANHDSTAAVSTALAAEIYGLDVLAEDIEDHPENQTRFFVVGRHNIPAPTGHDKTTLLVFQHADRPGSLLSILQEFAARAINLTKLESRPTKRSLGDYCFILDLEGHVADEVVADCLRNLRSKHADVKLLGSYPAAGSHGPALRRETDAAWKAADEWLVELRNRIVR